MGKGLDEKKLEERVEAWHRGDSDLPLHEYLDMTWDEYKDWVEGSGRRRFEYEGQVVLYSVLGEGDIIDLVGLDGRDEYEREFALALSLALETVQSERLEGLNFGRLRIIIEQIEAPEDPPEEPRREESRDHERVSSTPLTDTSIGSWAAEKRNQITEGIPWPSLGEDIKPPDRGKRVEPPKKDGK